MCEERTRRRAASAMNLSTWAWHLSQRAMLIVPMRQTWQKAVRGLWRKRVRMPPRHAEPSSGRPSALRGGEGRGGRKGEGPLRKGGICCGAVRARWGTAKRPPRRRKAAALGESTMRKKGLRRRGCRSPG